METIVTLKITLLRAKPPIWRRLEVLASYNLGELHITLNAAMGWLDSHLHMFDVDGRDFDPTAFNAGEVSELLRKVAGGELPEEWD